VTHLANPSVVALEPGLIAAQILLGHDFRPVPAPVPAGIGFLGIAATVGTERATASLVDFLAAGFDSDDWTAAILGAPQKDVSVPPLKETLSRWRKRKILDSRTFENLADELKGQAGRLAGVWHTRFVEAVYGSLFDAMADGLTLQDWIPRAQSLLDQFGADTGLRIFSGETWSPWYSDLVFRNANAAATAGGRYAEMFSREWIRRAPFWLYDAINDSRTRPAHLALDGMVFRKDDPAARKFLPPIDHNCRCSSIETDQGDVDDAGYKVARGRDVDVKLPEGWDADRVASLVPEALRNLKGSA
jgi:SPP1 gp7 family putative phage head morphogenesis protein